MQKREVGVETCFFVAKLDRRSDGTQKEANDKGDSLH